MKSNTFVVGIDIGTQGVKGGLFSSLGDCIAEYGEPSRLEYPEKGAITEDPEYQYRSVLNVIRTLIETSEKKGISSVRTNISCVAIDGQMAGVIGIGSDGIAVTPYDSWLDGRCAPYSDLMKKEAHDEILKKAGTAPSRNHGPKILWWKHERPEVYARIEKFVQPGAYAAMRLCGLAGREGFIDRTYLHFSGFSDTAQGTWDEGLCNRFGVAEEKLPRIVDSTAIIGKVSKEAALASLMQEGTLVAAGCGDTVASFLSSGAVEEGMSVDVAGTASVFACTQPSFVPDTKHGILGCCASVVPSLWYSYAYINGGGMNPEWFLKLFGSEQGSSRFKEIEEEVQALGDSHTYPLFIPHMAGRVMPGRPDLRGSFAGMHWDHTKPHLFRAVLEAVALEYGLYKQAAIALQPGLELREVRVTGGGERSALWNTMKSGVLQLPYVRIKQHYGAPMGIAMVAAVACGLYDSFASISRAWIDKGEVISCDESRYPFFAKRLDAYGSLLESMEKFTAIHPFVD